VLRDTEAHDAAIDLILATPVTMRPRFAEEECGQAVWRGMAERGVFAYDSSVYGGPYRKIAAPWVAAPVRALPGAAAAVAGLVVLAELSFEELDEIPEAVLQRREMPVLRPSLIDLTDKLRAARSAGPWSDQRFGALGLTIADVIGWAGWDWDRGAGEDWGAVVTRHGNLAVRLWRRGRFAFVHAHDGARALDDLRGRGVVCQIVHDWERADYAVAREALPELFDGEWPLEAVDPAAMSANELWWATV
jgi:hypothetical protein